MAQPEGKCPHCGGPVAHVKMAVEYVVIQADKSVRGASRNFWGQCPEHGKVMAITIMGNHATLGEAELKRRYSKHARKLILRELETGEERKAFRLAIVGKRRPEAGEIRRWDKLSVGARASKFDQWTAFLRGRRA